jgi:hypothetical protein
VIRKKTKTAQFVRDVSDNYRGTAHLYELDPPMPYSDGVSFRYVVVSAVDVWANMLRDLEDFPEQRQRTIDMLGKYAYTPYGMGKETYIFASDDEGEILANYDELPGSFRGDMDIPQALRDAGYDEVLTPSTGE